MAFSSVEAPVYTPWGVADTRREVAPGIVFCSTPGHGGFYLSQERYEAMPSAFRDEAKYAGPQYFEEDCEWALVVLAFPNEFSAENLATAKHTAEAWFPHLLESA